MADDCGEYKVQVYLYDLSQGMVKGISQGFLGKQIDGIWHTGVVIHYKSHPYPREWFYGGGIQVARAGSSTAGKPVEIIDMGTTQIPLDVFNEFLREISPNFTPQKYSLFKWNCNNFSDEVCKFLVGKGIPSHITGLPSEVLNTPMGQMFLPFITQMENQMKQGGGGTSFLPGWEDSSSSTSSVKPAPALNNPANIAAAAQQILNQNPALASAASSALAGSTAQISPAAAPATNSDSQKAVTNVTNLGPLSDLCYDKSHQHQALNLNVVSLSTRPLLSMDDKAAQFRDMVCKHSIALESSGIALTADEKKALDDLVNHLQNNPRDSLAPPPPNAIAVFERIILAWPADTLFPVLALFRLLLTRPTVAEHFVNRHEFIGSMLERCFPSNGSAPPPSSAQLMALCSASNLFARLVPGRFFASHEAVLRAAKFALSAGSKSSKVLRVMGATVLLNVALHSDREGSDAAVEVLSALHECAHVEQDYDTLSRLLSALGHLIYCNTDAAAILMSLEFPAASHFDARVHNVVGDIHAMLKCAELD